MSSGEKTIDGDITFKGDITFEGGVSSNIDVPAFENLAAGDFVDLFDDGGTLKARLAIADDKDNPKKADGYVDAAVTAGNTATVLTGGTNANVSGVTKGGDVFLSDTTPGAVTATAPTALASFAQPLGTGITGTSMNVDIDSVPGAGATENRLPLDDRTTTPLDTEHRALTYSEQIIGFSKQGDSTLFFDKGIGLLTRRVTNTLSTGSGNALALSLDNVLFHVNSVGGVPKLNRIDPTRDNVTFIANLSFPGTLAANAPTAMDFHPATGVCYVIVFDISDTFAHLGTLDIITGVVTDIGPMGVTATADAFAIDPTDPTKAFMLLHGAFEASSGFFRALLFSVNLVTGAATVVNSPGDTGFDRGSAMAFDEAGILHAIMVKRSDGVQKLCTINTITAVKTEVASTFYEDQFPGAGNHSCTDMTFRRLSNAASEFSFAQHGAGQDGHEFGVANAYEFALHPHPQTLEEGARFSAVMGFPNTGVSTGDVSKIGLIPIVLKDGSALSGGEILAQRHTFVVRSSNLELQDPANEPKVTTIDGAQADLLSVAVASDETIGFTIWITARRTDADNESAYYRIDGAIDNNAGTTALVGAITKATIAEDTAAWDVTAEADNGTDTLEFKVTGEAAKTIDWSGRIELTRVSG